MSLLRPLLLLAIVVGACYASMTLSQHHAATNDQAFQALYMHLVPAPLEMPGSGSHGHGDEGHGDEGHGADNSHAVAGHGSDAHGADAHHGELLFAPTLPLPAAMDMDPAHEGTQIAITNLQIFQIAAVLFVLIAFSGVAGYLRTGRGDAISRLGAGFCLYIRDEMVEPNMHGHFGRRFLPYFLSVFFFILLMNLMGLVPGSATATASVFVTAALALTTFLGMVGCGMAAQGPLEFWKNLVPHGLPPWLVPLMFIVELLGLFVKPFALMIRLFANMSGGHMVVLSFMGLIFFFAGNDFSNLGYAVSPNAVGFAVFIMIIEGFVAMLQAYIFTQLSIMFVGASVHPEH